MSKSVAHRGASARANQNTIVAFELAYALGADFIEFDVLQTRDGVLIVKHDEWIDNRHVSDISYPAIVADPRFSDVPTLAEVLDRLAGHVKLYVELKWVGYEQQVIDMLHAHVDNSQFVIISFIDDVILNTKRYDPGIRAGLCLVHRNPHTGQLIITKQDIFHMGRVRNTMADFIAPRHIPVAIIPSIINAYWYDIPLYVWVVNNYWAYRFLSLFSKVETIACDFPPHMTADSLYNHPHRRRLKQLLQTRVI